MKPYEHNNDDNWKCNSEELLSDAYECDYYEGELFATDSFYDRLILGDCSPYWWEECPMERFVALDFERATTWRASICQIGLVEVEHGIIVKSHTWLVRPPQNKYTQHTIDIHGITPEKTRNAQSFPKVWKRVKDYLERELVVVHGSTQDIISLSMALDHYKLEYPYFEFVCTHQLSKILFPNLPNSLEGLCKEFDIPFENHHEACNDARACAKLLLKMCEKLDVESIRELLHQANIKKGKMLSRQRRVKEMTSITHNNEDASNESVYKIDKI